MVGALVNLVLVVSILYFLRRSIDRLLLPLLPLPLPLLLMVVVEVFISKS